MKKYFLLALIFCIVVINSCTKDKASVYIPPSCGGVVNSANLYSNHVGAILLTYCASQSGCHSQPAPQLGIDLTTYTGAKSTFQNSAYNIPCFLEHGSGCPSVFWMPYTPNPQLPDSLIQYLICWQNNGCQP
jgi:hypothetical protein